MAIEQQIEELRRELLGVDEPEERLVIAAELKLAMEVLGRQDGVA